MTAFLIAAGFISWLIAFVTFGMATALPHQLFAGLIGVARCVLFAGGAIVMAIDQLRAVTMEIETARRAGK